MALSAYPLYIQGPCILTFDGKVFRSKGDVKVDLKRNSFTVETALHGVVATRHKSQNYEISFQPDGTLGDFAKFFPYNPGNIGQSIFGAVGSPKSLVILARNGQQHTFHRAAVMKSPSILLSATNTLYQGEMQFVAIQKGNVAQTDAAAYKTLAATAFADATYAGEKPPTARYLATWGATYIGMMARAGFKLDLVPTIRLDEVDSYGIVDGTLDSVVATASFAPANLTEAEVDALLALQGDDAILPGEDYSKAGNDLVIADEAGEILTVTLKNAGPKDLSQVFGKAHRHGDLGWASSRTWTGAVADPLLVLEQPA